MLRALISFGILFCHARTVTGISRETAPVNTKLTIASALDHQEGEASEQPQTSQQASPEEEQEYFVYAQVPKSSMQISSKMPSMRTLSCAARCCNVPLQYAAQMSPLLVVMLMLLRPMPKVLGSFKLVPEQHFCHCAGAAELGQLPVRALSAGGARRPGTLAFS